MEKRVARHGRRAFPYPFHKKEGNPYRSQNSKRNPCTPGNHLFRPVCAAVYLRNSCRLAAGIYLGLGNIIGKEAASWLCLLVAAPVAIAGFFHYNGMSLEQFLWAFIKSEILCAGPRRFDSVNLHEELFSDLEGLQE